MDKEELQKIREDHERWFCTAGHLGYIADLKGANLEGAELKGAYLFSARLTKANLTDANLRGSNLVCVDFEGANLKGANLERTNLKRANLVNANLEDANLQEARLENANLEGANLEGAKLPEFQIPQNVDLTGWKKLRNDRIAKLRIPAEAKRTASLIGNKCRCEYAEVVEITSEDGTETFEDGQSLHFEGFEYQVGMKIEPDKYDGDIKVECTNGIHFFIDKKDAVNY